MSKKKEITPFDVRVASCNELHRTTADTAKQARDLAEKACHLAVLLGLQLQQLKSETPHGEWGKFFRDRKSAHNGKCAEFEFSQDTATRYMRAAEGALARPGLPVAARKRIEKLAASDGTEWELTDSHHSDLDKATRGETLRQLYIDLGIIRASAAERGAPEKVTNNNSDTDPPKINLADEIYQSLASRFRHVSNEFEQGNIGHLRPEQLKELEDLLRSYLDDLKKVNKK